LIILNGVTSANSLNYLWYVFVFDKYLWIIGLLIFLSLFWIILELRYSLSCFEYYARSNILNTDSSRLWENKFSSTERSDLGDDFCRSLFVLCPLDILLSVSLRFMDSDYLFGIFKLLLHINSKELLAQAYAMLAKFDTTLTSHLGFPDPKYFIFFTVDFKCTQWRLLQKRLYYVGFLVWLFGFVLYRKNCWPSQFTFSFHYYHSH
jgi:hypothetical protein